MRLRCLLVALIVLASGCDSGGNAPPPVVPPPAVLRQFDLTGLPARLEIELTDADTFAVPGLFGPGRPTGLSVGITGTSGATATAEPVGLVVRAEALGEATVTLTATALGYRDTTATLVVRVVPGICPPGAPAGIADLYPIEDGVVARYLYSGESSDLNPVTPLTRTSAGTLTATFSGVACLNRRRTFQVRYRASGTVTTRLVGSPTPSSTFPFSNLISYPGVEDAANVVTFTLPTIAVGFHDVTVPRYSSEVEPTREQTVLIGGRACPSSATFRAGTGLIRETVSCYVGSGSSATQSLTPQP